MWLEKQQFNVSQEYHSRRGKVRNEAGRRLGEEDWRRSDKLQGQICNHATSCRMENGWTRGKTGAAGLGSAQGQWSRKGRPRWVRELFRTVLSNRMFSNDGSLQ